MKINFLLPHFGVRPTGGFKIAYQYANYLANEGYEVNIIHAAAMEDGPIKYIRYLKSYIKLFLEKNKWFIFNKNINLLYVLSISDLSVPNADVTIATAWQTAEKLEKLSSEKGSKMYLIQHYEIWNGEKEDVDRTWKYDMHKILISKWLMNIAKEMGVKRITYIPNALDHDKFKILNNVEDRELIVSMMYSDAEWKGAMDGINALTLVKNRYPQMKVKFFGKCKKPHELPEWIEYYENPEQEFLIKEIYNKAAVFLCPSWFEGWGLPPMEAMACGCAVVTTDNGGVLDFAINDKTALICEVKNVFEMSESIIRLFGDKSFRIRLSINGNNYIKNFNWEKSFIKFEEVIRKYGNITAPK